MRLCLTLAFLLGANSGLAFGEGRYTAVPGRDLSGPVGVYVIDTKTGSVKFCYTKWPDVKCGNSSKN